MREHPEKDMHSPLVEQAATVLEWPRLLEVLAGHAHSTMGSERCRSLPLEGSIKRATIRLRETAEMVALRESADHFRPSCFPILETCLAAEPRARSWKRTNFATYPSC